MRGRRPAVGRVKVAALWAARRDPPSTPTHGFTPSAGKGGSRRAAKGRVLDPAYALRCAQLRSWSARRSLGKEECNVEDRACKPCSGTQRGLAPPGKRSRQPVASLAQAGSNPRRRGVDSECAGRGIEPRKVVYIAGADAVMTAEGNTDAQYGLGAAVPPGSKARACTQGSPRNLGVPIVSTFSAGRGNRQSKPPARRAAVAARREWRHGQHTKRRRERGTAKRRKRSAAGRTVGRRSIP